MGALTGAAAPILAFAAVLTLSPALGGSFGVRTVVAALIVAGLSVIYGRAMARWLARPLDAEWHGGFVVVAGFSAVSLVHLLATSVLGVNALMALVVDVLGAAGLARFASAGRESDPPPEAGRAIRDAATLVAIGCLAAAWARQTIFAVATVDAAGVFTAWQDYFLHAAEVTYLKHYAAFDGTSLYLAGSPQPLYHRASYAMTALFSDLGGVPSLEAATRFWLPTGLVLCMTGLHTLGSALAGRLGGVAAVALVFLLPDASTYGFHNRFLSFHWLLQMAAGSGYAIAMVLLGLTVIVTADRARHWRACVAAMGCVGASAAFRMHVGVLAGGMVALVALSAWRPQVTRTTIALAATVLVAVGGALAWLESVSLAPHFLSQHAHPVLFMLSIHSQAAALPTPYTGWTAQYGDIGKVAVGYAMFIVAAFGHLAIALGLAYAGGALRPLGWRVAIIPLALVASHLGVLLLVPTPAHGDLTDFGHRPIVLMYVVFGALAGAAVAGAISAWSRRRCGHNGFAWAAVVLAVVAGSAVPWSMGATLQQRWMPQYATIPVAADAWAAARFVRAHAAPADTVMAASVDPLAAAVAVSERRAWASRSSLYTAPGAGGAAMFAERIVAHEAMLAGVESFEQLQSFGRHYGVGWYIADVDRTRGWPESIRRHCVYCGGVAVYDLR